MRTDATSTGGASAGSPLWSRRLLVAPALAALAAAPAAPLPAQVEPSAQVEETAALRPIAGKRVAVGGDETSLRLDFGDGATLEVDLSAGVISVDGEPIGEYAPGGPLHEAWRELVARAVSLEDEALARALVDWAPPSDLSGTTAAAARVLDERLQAAFVMTSPEPAGDAAVATTAADQERAAAVRAEVRERMDALLRDPEWLAGLARALDDIDVDDARIHVGEDVAIDEDERVDSDLVVVGGDLDVRGRVRGDVVVVGGTARVHDGGGIDGDLRLAEARLADRDGEIEGDVVRLDGDDLLAALRDEARVRQRRSDPSLPGFEARETRHPDGGAGLLAPVRWIVNSVTDLLASLIGIALLALVGGVAVHFAPRPLEGVAETARRDPLRAGAVGLAGAFLVVPIWVLGAVVLAVSIIGLPVLIVWIPLFALAVMLATGLGYFAVAKNVGGWMARHPYPYLDWVRTSNPYTLVVGGVLALTAVCVLATLVGILGPWTGFLQGILMAAGALITVAATTVGFGAVILSRAGRRPSPYGGGFDPFDDDPGWGWDPPPPPSPGTSPGSSAAASPGSSPSASPARAAGAAEAATADDPAAEFDAELDRAREAAGRGDDEAGRSGGDAPDADAERP